MAKAIEETYSAASARLYSAVLRSVTELGYSITHSDSGAKTVSFSTGISMRSWSGQNMTATVSPVGEGEAKVVIGGTRDQKGNPLGGGGQVFDWGEKGKISRKLLERLDNVLPDVPEPSGPSPGVSTPGELERLVELRTQGMLTEEEFVAAKARLLGLSPA